MHLIPVYQQVQTVMVEGVPLPRCQAELSRRRLGVRCALEGLRALPCHLCVAPSERRDAVGELSLFAAGADVAGDRVNLAAPGRLTVAARARGRGGVSGS